MQEKVLEFWSLAPLPEGEAGKDTTAPDDLKKPEAADLEVSSDSSIGDGSDVEVVGVSAPPAAPRRRRHAVRKIPASKAGLWSALPREAPSPPRGRGVNRWERRTPPNCLEKAPAPVPDARKGRRCWG